MAISSLRFRHENPYLETKSGSYIYDCTLAQFHAWEFRRNMQWQTRTDEKEKVKMATKISEGLRGQALQMAIDIGPKELATDEGMIKLI